MREQPDPIGFKTAPKWQQVFISVLFLGGAVVGGLRLIDAVRDSPEARAIKGQLNPLAERLEDAQKVGDHQALIALLDPVTKIVSDYNDLDEAKRNEINGTPLRYCVLASLHLSSGINEVIQAGSWLSRDKFQSALDMCK